MARPKKDDPMQEPAEPIVPAVEGAEFDMPEAPALKTDAEYLEEAKAVVADLLDQPFSDGPHALDSAPVNSKIVVVRLDGKNKAVLAMPSGTITLPVGDAAARLPEGARIAKVADGKFVSTQLSPAIDCPPLHTKTAIEAIVQFIPHFHGPTDT